MGSLQWAGRLKMVVSASVEIADALAERRSREDICRTRGAEVGAGVILAMGYSGIVASAKSLPCKVQMSDRMSKDKGMKSR